MYECDICKAKFNDHTSLSNHIFSAHGNGVNWNSRSRKPGMSNGSKLIAAVAGIALAASLFVAQAKAQDAPQPTPSVGEPPKALRMVYLPMVSASDNDIVTGTVSWCPSCSPR